MRMDRAGFGQSRREWVKKVVDFFGKMSYCIYMYKLLLKLIYIVLIKSYFVMKILFCQASVR